MKNLEHLGIFPADGEDADLREGAEKTSGRYPIRLGDARMAGLLWVWKLVAQGDSFFFGNLTVLGIPHDATQGWRMTLMLNPWQLSQDSQG